MSRRLKYDIPGPDWRRSAEQIAAEGLEATFSRTAAPALARPLELVVEIGFGRGEFLLAMAAERPQTAFLGIELSFKRVLKMARRLAPTDLRNVRLVHGRAEQVLREALPAASVREFWINFPDPWPKKRHAKHRLVQPAHVARIADRLAPGGVVHAATDDRAYAEQMDEVFGAEARLENLHAPMHWLPEVPGRMQTAYEREWRREGRPLHFFAYRRRPAEAPRNLSDASSAARERREGAGARATRANAAGRRQPSGGPLARGGRPGGEATPPPATQEPGSEA